MVGSPRGYAVAPATFDERYERVRLLGEGAFGAAYLVRTRSKPSVLHVEKDIRIAHLTEKQREVALAESEVLKRMSHSNIVAYVTSFLEGPNLHIVMEYADGGDLATKIRERREQQRTFSEREVMYILIQIFLALQHVHSRKILHRDLKPLNIFMTRQGVMKLGDFGIARVMDSSSAGAQTAIGTPSYLSPEICNGESYGIKSDVWALGIVSYELVCLRVPFQGSNLPAVVMRICGGEPDPLPDTCPPELASIVTSFLEKEPAKRPKLATVLQLPIVQRYAQDLLSHARESGTGGCEAMVRPRSSSSASSSSGGRSLRAGNPPRKQWALPDHQRQDAGFVGDDIGSDRQRRKVAVIQHAQHDREQQHLQRLEELEIARREAFEARLSMQKRMSQQSRSEAAAEALEQRGAQDDDASIDAERHKAAVLRHAQQDREEEHARRLEELERARREAFEAKELLRRRHRSPQPEFDEECRDAFGVDAAGVEPRISPQRARGSWLPALVSGADTASPASSFHKGVGFTVETAQRPARAKPRLSSEARSSQPRDVVSEPLPSIEYRGGRSRSCSRAAGSPDAQARRPRVRSAAARCAPGGRRGGHLSPPAARTEAVSACRTDAASPTERPTPTPHGHGTVSQMQDALAGVLGSATRC